MTKKIFSLLLTLVISIGAWADGIEINGMWYNLNTSKKTAELTFKGHSYSSYSEEYTGDITIPSTVTYNETEYSVTSIGDYTFRGCIISSVTMPNSITSIGNYAFYGCGLNSVDIPGSVTKIGENAFGESLAKVNIKDLTAWCQITFNSINSNPLSKAHLLYLNGTEVTDLIIPDDVTSIGNYVFYGCSAFTSVTIPNGVTSIGISAFRNCTGLTSATIGNSVTSIGNYAFEDCAKLTSITIGNNVTSIANLVFSGCKALSSIIVATDNPNYRSVDGVLFDKGLTKLIQYPAGKTDTEYTIPNSVTSIGEYAFYICTGLTSVTIPNSVTSIGSNAFYECSGLTSITLSNKIKRIGNYAFYNCNSLTSIQFPNSVTDIGTYAFYGCGLNSVDIPNSVTSIGSNAFSSCSGLTSITLSNSLKSIGSSAFSSCSGLTSVTIPDSVTSIGSYAFSNCSGLKSVTIGSSVTNFENYVFRNCSNLTSVTLNSNTIVSKNYTSSSNNLSSLFGTQVAEYILGDSIKKIGDYAFYGCSSLKSITIPYSVTSMGSYAFRNCSNLISVTLNSNTIVSKNYSSSQNIGSIFGAQVTEYIFGDSITSIGEYAFYSCSGLTSVILPYSVTSIGYDAFYNCSGLTSVIMLNPSAPKRDNSKFYSSAQSKVPLYVLSEKVRQSYIAAGWNKEFSNIKSGLPSDVDIPYRFPYTVQGQSKNPSMGKVTVEKTPSGWQDPTAKLQATAEKKSRFLKWSDGNTDNPREINVFDYGSEYNVVLEAEFWGQNTINVSKSGNGNASFQLIVSEQPVASGATISDTLDNNSSICVVVIPADDSFFRKWSDGKTTLENSFTLTEDINLTAEVLKKHEVKILSDGNGSSSGSGSYADEYVEISALANDPASYRFDHWSDGNTENPRTIYVTSDSTLTAYFIQAWDGKTNCKPAGSGTELQPYLITRACELLWYAQNNADDDYAIMDNDISLYGNTWEPIGTQTKPYKGHFDGRNHYIKDFVINAASAGVFGYASNATIENIKVSDATVTGTGYAGIICAQAVNSDIIACDNFAKVSGMDYVGGICGSLSSGKVSNCNNEGEVVATGNYAGGVAGTLISATVEACVNVKSVISRGQYVGGIVGSITGSSTISQCASAETATVRGTKYVGGLCGNVTGGSIISSSNYGAVNGSDQEVGGLIGTLDGASAQELTNYGRVFSSSSQTGGVVGSSKNNSTLSYCANAGWVIANSDRNVGGLIGNAQSTNILSSINTGVVKGNNYTGGLVGYMYENSQLSYSINYGPVSGTDRVGGVAGEARAKIKECISTGYVDATGNYVGAICGYLQQASYADLCIYDKQTCPLDKAFGYGNGDGEGYTTAELTGSITDLELTAWTMANGVYPRPTNLASLDIAQVGASAVLFAENEDAQHFGTKANLTTAQSRVKWSSKGGTQISGTEAKPAIIGLDTLYATRNNAVKAVPVNVTASSIPSYTLSVTAGIGGSVNNVNGKYAEGTEVEITATPDTTYHFLQWSDGNADNPRTVTMNKDMTLEAQFEKDPTPTYTLTVSAGTGGTVDKQGGTFDEGTEVTITAMPNAGYRFTQWSDGNTDNPRTIIVTENIAITAQFEEIPPQQYTLTVTASEGGSVNTAGGVYNEGTPVTLTATPNNEDYIFVKWSDGNTDNPRTLTMTEDITLKAEFAKVAYWQLTISAGEGGTASSDKNGSYRTGTQVTISATPSNEDYYFVKWSDGNTDNPRTLTMTADTTLKAEFAKVAYWQLTLSAGEGGTAKADKDGPYRTGSQVTITATPNNEDYYFTQWSDGNTDNPRTLTMTEDITLKAEFAQVAYWQLTVVAGEGGSVSSDKNGSYKEGSEVTISATPKEDYRFVKWSDGNTDNPRTIVMKANTTLAAIFAEIAYSNIWIGTTVGGKADTDKSGKYTEGTTLTITATPEKGYVFVRWSDGSTANPLIYTVTGKDEMVYPVFRSIDCAQ